MPLPNVRAGAAWDRNGHEPQCGCDIAAVGILGQCGVRPREVARVLLRCAHLDPGADNRAVAGEPP